MFHTTFFNIPFALLVFNILVIDKLFNVLRDFASQESRGTKSELNIHESSLIVKVNTVLVKSRCCMFAGPYSATANF